MIWVTSDTHFNHTNIIKYTQRPFESIIHHDRELIRRWNERVAHSDTVVHLGDFAFKTHEKDIDYYREQLNGTIILVKGNHDSTQDAPIRGIVIHHKGIDWWCEHYPSVRYKHNLCGHLHRKYKIKKRRMDVVANVSTDVWNYAPVSMDEIMDAVKEAPYGESK